MGLRVVQRLGVVETRHALSLRHIGLYVSCLHLTHTKPNVQNKIPYNYSIGLNQRTPLPLRFSQKKYLIMKKTVEKGPLSILAKKMKYLHQPLPYQIVQMNHAQILLSV
jgi:hypothetical protein